MSQKSGAIFCEQCEKLSSCAPGLETPAAGKRDRESLSNGCFEDARVVNAGANKVPRGKSLFAG